MWKMTWIQLMNRWRSNVSICVELLLVFCLTWYMVDYFFVEIYNKHLPAGRDYTDVWWVEIDQLPETSVEYREAENDSVALIRNVERVVERLRAYPGVKEVGLSLACGSKPYSGCYWGMTLENVADTSKYKGGMTYRIDPATDFLSVFYHRGADGERLVSTADFDWSDPRAILISRGLERALFGDASALGKEVRDKYSKGEETYVVKGIVEDIKRFDWQLPEGGIFLPYRFSEETIAQTFYFVRIDPAIAGSRFAEEFRELMSRELRIGNFYLRSLTSYDRIKADTAYSFGRTYNYRVRLALMIFLGVNILLCVMGTFWYRVRTRRGEIGLRMAVGSPRKRIRWQMVREGICLLLLAMPFALLIESQLVIAGLMDLPGNTFPEGYWPAILPLRFLLVNLLTGLLLALVIVLAVWLPATKAAGMEPAEALRYDG